MSVINSMLRALDARGAGKKAGPDAPGATATDVAGAAPLTAALPPLDKKPRAPATRLAVIALAGAGAIGFTAFADFGSIAGKPTPAVAATPSGEQATGAATLQPAAATAATAPATEATAASASIAPAMAPGASPGASPAPSTATSTATSPAAPPAATATAAPAAPARAAATNPPNAPQNTSAAMAAAATTATPPLPTRVARLADSALVPPTPGRVDKRMHGLSAEQRLAQLYRQAVDAAQAGQRQAALAKCHELLAAEPRHVPARQLAAALEQEAGAPQRAMALLHEGLALDERQAAFALPLARLLATQGQADEALAVLERHAVRGPEADGLRAGVLARRGDYAAALPAYEAAARAQPMNAMWWLGLGVALESMSEPARARQAFAKAHAVGLPREDLTAYVEQRLRALE